MNLRKLEELGLVLPRGGAGFNGAAGVNLRKPGEVNAVEQHDARASMGPQG